MSSKEYRDWLKKQSLSNPDVVRLGRELLERFEGEEVGVDLINLCRDAIASGYTAYKKAKSSVTFSEAVRVSLREREGRRKRTTQELRNICNRLMSGEHALRDQNLRALDVETCRTALEIRFQTPRQYAKARSVLHSIFACGLRHGWCSENPVQGITAPTMVEARVNAMPWEDILRLLSVAMRVGHRRCMAPLGLMLWAGVRPAELERLRWEDIDWEENVINLSARHTKTGGSRHITLYPVLREWLLTIPRAQTLRGAICPPNWLRRWKALRRASGLRQWQQDILRHTFASYHLKHWHDLARLQEEMGHRSLHLLRTRYLSMHGVTARHAADFWSPALIASLGEPSSPTPTPSSQANGR